jgi:hypothetical protein
MRLTVQSFERKFNPEDPEIIQKWKTTRDIDSTNWHYECRRMLF